MLYDVTIIGGGPAGCAASVYAARKLLKTALITESFGGQSLTSGDIQNWIGTISLSGDALAKALESHVRAYAGTAVDIMTGERVENVTRTDKGFLVTMKGGKTVESKTVLVATGGSRRELAVPGAKEFDQKGLTYCASCDGPLFSGQDVLVVGGGNAGFETAAQLLAYCTSVTLLEHNKNFVADPVTVQKVLAHPNMKGITNAEVETVFGDKFVKGVTYRDLMTDTVHTLNATGIFVEIGLVTATSFVKDIVNVDRINRIIVHPKSQQTSVPGIWAAGDCTDALYHQNNIAAGDAVKAIEDIYVWLNAK
ncbi:MAG: FAD-dependent oxidoreductase [Patescibacteria group bacterium]